MGKVEVRMKDKLKAARRSSEKDVIMEVLEKTGGNVNQAAKKLKRHRNWIHALIRRHSLEDFVKRLRIKTLEDQL
jgi:transcriptional regulator with GAF, ATPase, and Fis domain